MSIAKLLAPLACAVSFAGAAQAQLPPPYLEYGAKFTCGQETKEPDADVVVGTYATSINIHNPQAKLSVKFVKKIVVAEREGAEFVKPVVLRGVLQPDQADRVDCVFIDNALKLPPATYVEGFVVLEVPPVSVGSAPTFPLLDVVGKYTARPLDGGVSTQSVVPYIGKQITN